MPLLTQVSIATSWNAGSCIIKQRNMKQTLPLCDRNCFQILFYVKALSLNDTHSLNKWAVTGENVLSDMCPETKTQISLRNNAVNQSLRCQLEETLYPWESKMRWVNILIRLRECAGWSESSLGGHVRRHIFWHEAKIEYVTWKRTSFTLFSTQD